MAGWYSHSRLATAPHTSLGHGLLMGEGEVRRKGGAKGRTDFEGRRAVAVLRQ